MIFLSSICIRSLHHEINVNRVLWFNTYHFKVLSVLQFIKYITPIIWRFKHGILEDERESFQKIIIIMIRLLNYEIQANISPYRGFWNFLPYFWLFGLCFLPFYSWECQMNIIWLIKDPSIKKYPLFLLGVHLWSAGLSAKKTVQHAN